MKRSQAIATAVLAVALAASACGGPGGEKVDVAGLTLSDAGAAGRDLYAAHCTACHGGDLAGASGPALGPSSGAATESAEDLTKIIAHGAAGMPAWAGTLSTQEIADVVTFLIEVQGR